MADACCSKMDWSAVIDDARRKGERTPEHHPDCPTQQPQVSSEGLKALSRMSNHARSFYDRVSPDATPEQVRAILGSWIDDYNDNLKIDTGPLETTVTLKDAAYDFLEHIQAQENIRYLRIGNLEIKMRLLSQAVSERAIECQMEILEVLSPPEARAAWLKELEQDDCTLD